MRLHEDNSNYEITFGEAKVSQIILDYRLTIVLEGDQDEYLTVVIGNSFTFITTHSRVPVAIDLQDDAPSLGSLISNLRFQQLSKCAISREGKLVLNFESGLVLEVPPSAHYEAWDIDHKNFKIVATPGGKLAIWDR